MEGQRNLVRLRQGVQTREHHVANSHLWFDLAYSGAFLTGRLVF